MLRPRIHLAALLTALLLGGCSSARKTDVLEARLRSQEDMLAVYESEMSRVKNELSIARRESEDMRLQLAATGKSIAPAEESGAAFRASGIQFSSLMTGGADIDGQPGHDALTVVLIPHDRDGELVKLPGNVEIEAFDLSKPGNTQRIGHWKFDQREIHQFWHKGVIQSGYQFELPWQTPPQSDEVLIVGHLSTANGRDFDTTLTVKVDPPARTGRRAMVEGVQQASAEVFNPFANQMPGTDRTTTASDDDEILWADGEAPVPRSAPKSGDVSQDFIGGTASDAVPSATRRIPRPQPPAGQPVAMPSSVNREIPPPIHDAWDDDWATDAGADASVGVETSDSISKETPFYRR